ncbi:hypothetical protein CXB51_019010 [Gossypium anomalum]|uniref:RNase H type-1 domain-containing protein n=1 Tax=Gossypium anomalum TaxID=47600 RepID=A0A8J5YAZ1_9ROSI|nr:hypothetical protein CXB51_019010 [Gossypium anomalum]
MKGLPLNAFPALSDEDFNLLNRPVFYEEIKTALFDMAPLKALGSDGFHALFYQSQWDHVGASIIANRFKVIFPKLIAPEQTGFLAGRNITDNIVIAQEVLWNGVPTLKFQPARGVRQSCLLSLYLFILCMEWLSHSIQAAIGVGKWSPIRLVRNGPSLSHLFFANDLILFGHAEEHQARIIKNILDDFCSYSGHRINKRNTNIFFSKGVNDNLRRSISSFFGFQEVNNLELYLGVPLFHERVANNTLRFVVDKVPNKLSSWDARQLSLASRGSTNGNTKIALVSWDSVCQPKAHGGLGLRHLEDHNTSFMMKMGFNIVSNTNALWVRVLRTKYGISSGLPRIYREGVVHSFGDPLLRYGPLSKKIFLGDGSWNLDLFRLWVPEEIIHKIVGIPPLHPSSGPDQIVWRLPRLDYFPSKVPMQRFELHRLLTNAERTRRAIGNSSACRICEHDCEDVLHVLRDCSAARTIWDNIIPEERRSRFYIGSLHNWLMLLGVLCVIIMVGWIIGFCRYLGNCTVVEAEFWGILDGLNPLLDRNFEKVIIQTDSLEAATAIQEGFSGNSNSTLVRRIHSALTALKQWKIQHIPYSENLVADGLAKSVRSRSLGLRLIEDPPMRT